MLRSMTGFGSGRATVASEEVAVEVRAVNGKFCEVKPRLPRELMALEAEASRAVKERVNRGVVELTVRRGNGGSFEPHVDEALAKLYADRFRALRERLQLSGEVTVADVVGAEGVVTVAERAPDLPAAGQALTAALAQALDGLLGMREREGEALRGDLLRRMEVVQALVAKVTAAVPETIDHYRERLHARVRELVGAEVDPQRMAHEVALFADRTDVTEELTRLAIHVDQFRLLLDSSEPAGRRMDFLVQEMNREVNTTGSKSQSAELAALVVELKAELERVREQVQNVE